jgi:protein TonB
MHTTSTTTFTAPFLLTLPVAAPRKLAMGSAIALAHLLVLALIMLNPGRIVHNTHKDTVVLMLPSMLAPPPQVQAIKLTKNVQIASLSTTAAPHIAVKSEVSELTLSTMSTPTVNEVAVAAPPMTTAQAPIARVESTGPKLVNAVEYIQSPQADYPSMAKRMGEEGRVIMQVLVNDKGRAERVEILKSSGFARLDESAKLALLRALFKPYLEDGKATTVLATASINFSLRG